MTIIFVDRRQDHRKWSSEARFQHFRQQPPGSVEMIIRGSIFTIFGHRRQKPDFRHFRQQAPESAKMIIRSPIFNIFGHGRQNQRKWQSETRFSIFSTTGARISENDYQKFDLHHSRPQAPGSTKMTIRSSIFNIFDHRRQDHRKWPSPAKKCIENNNTCWESHFIFKI